MASEHDHWRSWYDATGRDEVSSCLRQCLDRIDREVAEAGWVCQQSGRCCRFESFGHRLYMTGLEIAWFRRRLAEGGMPERDADPHHVVVSLPQLSESPDGCPYQIDGRCSVHVIRPFACRVFFCQQGSEVWQSARYEAFQTEIKRLHEQYNLPYRYMEWRHGLREAEKAGL
ncbi:MAG: hypothetical protein Kow00105_00430 [Phycisphaeraceae bacterium]